MEEEAGGLESLGKELSDALEKAAEYLSNTIDGINSVEAVLARREKELSPAEAKPKEAEEDDNEDRGGDG